MALNDYTTLTISQSTRTPTRAGFGTGLYLSYQAAWVERRRLYSSVSDVAVDFPRASGPEQRMATAYFAQDPAPPQLMIGRGANKPTKVVTLAPISPTGSALYAYQTKVKGDNVDDTTVTYTSDASPTDAEWAVGMRAALHAVNNKTAHAAWVNGTAYVLGDRVTNGGNSYHCITAGTSAGSGGPTTTSLDITDNTAHWLFLGTGTKAGANYYVTDNSGASPLTITALTAGDWFSIEVVSTNHQTTTETTTAPDVAADLTAIAAEDPNHYGVYTMFNSNAYGHAVSAAVESVTKIFIADTNDTTAISTSTGNGDLMDTNKTNAYSRTLVQYHPAPDQCAGAALLGACLPLIPGSETWLGKNLAGITPVNLTTTQRANIVAKNGNSYETTAGLNVTFNGMVGNGNFVDVTRGLDALGDDIKKSIFGAIASNPKIPYTDAGIAILESELRGALKRGVTAGIITAGFSITVPLAANVSPADKAARVLNGMTFNAQLQGAVHKGNVLGNIAP